MTDVGTATLFPPHPAIPLDVSSERLKKIATEKPSICDQLKYDIRSLAFFFNLNGRDWRLIFAQSYFNRRISPIWLLMIRAFIFVVMIIWLLFRYFQFGEDDHITWIPNFHGQILACCYAGCLTLLSCIAIFRYWRHCDGQTSSIWKLPGYYKQWTNYTWPNAFGMSQKKFGLSSPAVVHVGIPKNDYYAGGIIDDDTNFPTKILIATTWLLSSTLLPLLVGLLLLPVLFVNFSFAEYMLLVDIPTIILVAILFNTSNVPLLLYHLIYPITICFIEAISVYYKMESSSGNAVSVMIFSMLFPFLTSAIIYFIEQHKNYFVRGDLHSKQTGCNSSDTWTHP